MKLLKKLICLVLMFSLFLTLPACASGKQPSSGSDSSIKNEDSNKKDDKNNDDDKPEEYIPLSSTDMLLLGYNLTNSFFNVSAFSEDNDFGEFIIKNEILFINASRMLKNLSEFEDLIFNCILGGYEIEIQSKQNVSAVIKLNINFAKEDDEGNSSLKVKVLFGTSDKNTDLNYEFYDFLIESNKKQDEISLKCGIEKSKENGNSDSTADYYLMQLNGTIKDLETETYSFYQFERNAKITDYTTATVNSNTIKNFEQAEFDGASKVFISTLESDILLRDPNSKQIAIVLKEVGSLGQGKDILNMSGILKKISGLSESLIPCTDAETKIV